MRTEFGPQHLWKKSSTVVCTCNILGGRGRESWIPGIYCPQVIRLGGKSFYLRSHVKAPRTESSDWLESGLLVLTLGCSAISNTMAEHEQEVFPRDKMAIPQLA